MDVWTYITAEGADKKSQQKVATKSLRLKAKAQKIRERGGDKRIEKSA